MLTAVADTTETSVMMVRGIREQMAAMTKAIRDTDFQKDSQPGLGQQPFTTHTPE